MAPGADIRWATPLGPLSAGDRVALVAPAGPTPTAQLAAAQELLTSWDLEPVVYTSARAQHPRASYLAGEDAQRAADVQDAWCDPSIAGIFALRGGYGTLRILDLLEPESMRTARPKPLYGSSDLTALHEWLREQLGVASWFTPMIGVPSVLQDPLAVEALREAVLRGPHGRRWTAPSAGVLVPGTATGVLIGGNLSLLAMTLGARRRPAVDNSGTVALLEDVHEDTYRIDGYLTSLLRSGWFDGVRGVALGSWRDCGPLDEIRRLCLELLGPLGVPVGWELGFGHGSAAHSIPLGRPGVLRVEPGDQAELVLLSR